MAHNTKTTDGIHRKYIYPIRYIVLCTVFTSVSNASTSYSTHTVHSNVGQGMSSSRLLFIDHNPTTRQRNAAEERQGEWEMIICPTGYVYSYRTNARTPSANLAHNIRRRRYVWYTTGHGLRIQLIQAKLGADNCWTRRWILHCLFV